MCDLFDASELGSPPSSGNSTPRLLLRGISIPGSLAASCARHSRSSSPQHQPIQPPPDSPSSRFLVPAVPVNRRVDSDVKPPPACPPGIYTDATVAELLRLLEVRTSQKGAAAELPLHLARFRDFLLEKRAAQKSDEDEDFGGATSKKGQARRPLRSKDANSVCAVEAQIVAKATKAKKPSAAAAAAGNSKKPKQKKSSVQRAKSPPPPTPAEVPVPDANKRLLRRSASYPELLNRLADSIRCHLQVGSTVKASPGDEDAVPQPFTSVAVGLAIDELSERADGLGQLLERLAFEAQRVDAERRRLTAAAEHLIVRQQHLETRQRVPGIAVACQTESPTESTPVTSCDGKTRCAQRVALENAIAEEREQWSLQIEYLNYELNQLSERFEQSEFDRLEIAEQRNSAMAAARTERAASEERLKELEKELKDKDKEFKALEARYYECKYRAENCEFLLGLWDTKLGGLRTELRAASGAWRQAAAAGEAAATAATAADACDRLCELVTASLNDGLRDRVVQMCAEVKRC